MYLAEDLQVNSIAVRSDFVTILAAIVVDLDVSATAVRLYCYLAYKTGCWQFCNKDIKVALGIKSDHSISKYFKELIDGGYLNREEIKVNGRFAGYQYYLTVCQKMTSGEKSLQSKNLLKNQQNDQLSKNDKRLIKEEKEKATKEKEELFNINNINNNNNLIKEKNNKKEKKAAAFEIKSEVDREFFRYLEYRKKIKKSYKTDQSLGIVYKRFLNWCNGDANVARQIVDNTIANGWTGLFELKNNRNGRYVVNSNSSAYDVGIKA